VRVGRWVKPTIGKLGAISQSISLKNSTTSREGRVELHGPANPRKGRASTFRRGKKGPFMTSAGGLRGGGVRGIYHYLELKKKKKGAP